MTNHRRKQHTLCRVLHWVLRLSPRRFRGSVSFHERGVKPLHSPSMETLLRNSSYIFLFLNVLPCKKKEKQVSARHSCILCFTFLVVQGKIQNRCQERTSSAGRAKVRRVQGPSNLTGLNETGVRNTFHHAVQPSVTSSFWKTWGQNERLHAHVPRSTWDQGFARYLFRCRTNEQAKTEGQWGQSLVGQGLLLQSSYQCISAHLPLHVEGRKRCI